MAMIAGVGREGLLLLDVGCGTGASTAALLAAAPRARIIAVDASGGMLARARRKSWPSSVQFAESTVENLAGGRRYGPFDGVFAAYLLRNLADPDAGLRILRGLLRPGAGMAVHEYSVRDSVSAWLRWNLVCLSVIIPAGALATRDSALYRHLRRSVVAFDGVSTFQSRLERAGFTGVRAETMTGWQRGIVHTFLATAAKEAR